MQPAPATTVRPSGPRRKRARRQRGSVLVLAALLAMLMVGFVGLALDGGELTAQQRASQNAADMAALGAAYEIINNVSLSEADALARIVGPQNGIPAADLTTYYYDDDGRSTSNAASVATVKATVVHSFSTLFLPVVGIDSATVTATATVTVTQGTPCAVCILGSGLTLDNSSQIEVNGGSLEDNGNMTLYSSSNLQVDGGYGVGYGGTLTNNGGTISPSPSSDVNVSDPLASVPVPNLTGLTNYGDVSSCPVGGLQPGIYTSLSIGNSGSCTLNSTNANNVYVFEGNITLHNSASLDSGPNGVMLYMTCNPPPCATGASGAQIIGDNSATINLTSPSSGTYQGMAYFADRNNTSTWNFDNSVNANIKGTVYMATGGMILDNSAAESNVSGRLVIGSLFLHNSAQLIETVGTQNYIVPNSMLLTT